MWCVGHAVLVWVVPCELRCEASAPTRSSWDTSSPSAPVCTRLLSETAPPPASVAAAWPAAMAGLALALRPARPVNGPRQCSQASKQVSYRHFVVASVAHFQCLLSKAARPCS